MTHAREKGLLLYDGDCGFCRRWIEWLQDKTADCVDYRPFQERGDAPAELKTKDLEESIHFIDIDGTVSRGAEAFFQVMSYAPFKSAWLKLYKRLPLFASAAEGIYGIVARNRPTTSRFSKLLHGKDFSPVRYDLTRSLFLRGLGVIYLLAFSSFWMQADGLIGSNGILPSEIFIERVDTYADKEGFSAFSKAPTLCLLNPSPGFISFLCGAGCLAAVIIAAGFCTAPLLLICWAFYLSLSVAGQVFMGFQWENLLLEMGFLALFWSPFHWKLPVRKRTLGDTKERRALWLFLEGLPQGLARLLLVWLLFRLMVQSGLVKLASNDDVWWNLTALTKHYWTQPLPSTFGWYAHQLPEGFQKFSVAMVYVIEIGMAFLVLGARNLRRIACFSFLGLMLIIALTGSYTYFNLLTALLALVLLDDACWPAWLRQRMTTAPGTHWTAVMPTKMLRLFWVPAAIVSLLAITWAATCLETGTFYLNRTFSTFFKVSDARDKWWGTTIAPLSAPGYLPDIYPFRSLNGYGLFANMTEDRPEIILEGSMDNKNWLAYEFKYKPGDPSRAPRYAAPHQPRLDWQMWFAALGTLNRNPWLIYVMGGLLEDNQSILGLLDKNPFEGQAPTYIRAVVYKYEFTDKEEYRDSGMWWTRRYHGMYCSPIDIEQYRQFCQQTGRE